MRPQGRGGKARALALRIAELTLELRPRLDELKALEREFDALMDAASPPVIKAPKERRRAPDPVSAKVMAFFAAHPDEHGRDAIAKAVGCSGQVLSNTLSLLVKSHRLIRVRLGVYAPAVVDIHPRQLKSVGRICNGDE